MTRARTFGPQPSALGPSLALALALTLGIPAAAHIEAFSQAKPMGLGPYSALIEPKPSPMFANSALSMSAIFTDAKQGTYVTRIDAELELERPDGTVKTARLEPDGSGYFLASVAVREAGNYTARIVVFEGNTRHANETAFQVYPDLAVRLASANPEQGDPMVGEVYEIGIETLNNITRQRVDVLEDLTLILERWTDDHVTLLGVETLTMTRSSAGLWKATETFDVKGMYHLRFSSLSGGFKPDDVPILHVYALDPLPGSKKQTPLPGAVALLALGGAALLPSGRGGGQGRGQGRQDEGDGEGR